MKIPFLDLSMQYKQIKDEVQNSINNVIKEKAFISGPYAEKFEKAFAKFCGANYCISVNSGTSALHLALLAHGVGENDEVITVPNSFISTAWAISYCGAKPVFIDIDPNTCLMNPDLIQQSITRKTKAIIPVHLYGQPVELEKINRIASENNIAVIEDAAQAHRAMIGNKVIGSFGNTTCFSFYPEKSWSLR